MRHVLLAVLVAGALAWTAVLLLSPSGLQSPRWRPAIAHVYAASHRICHQRPERSFHLQGIQMPVCARCSGLYVSGAAGVLLGCFAFARPRPATTRLLLIGAAVPTALTWSVEMAGVMPMSNAARALAALPLGLTAGWVFVQMLRYDG